jgi:tetratricopeptide (TPR) repeat protein
MSLSPTLPVLTAEQRKIVLDRLQRASEVIGSNTNHDYAINLLMECVRMDPANLLVRQTMRRAQKAKYDNNLRGSRMAMITTAGSRARLKNCKRTAEHLRVLEIGEEILNSNPWDLGVQMDMAESADALGLLDMAVFMLDQARQKDSKDPSLNRALARLFEKRGNFKHAIALWQIVKDLDPSDVEANHKAKDLAASETIQRGNYGSNDSSALLPTLNKPATKSGMIPKVAKQVVSPLEQFQKAIKLDPTQVEPYLELAKWYRQQDNFDEAKRILEDGLAATGQHHRIQEAIAIIEIEPLRIDLQLAARRLETTNPDDLEEIQELISKLKTEIQSREIENLRNQADRQPNDLKGRLDLGIALFEAGRYDPAIVELQVVRKDTRLAWQAFIYLGKCFRKRRNWRLAQRNFADALNALPKQEEKGRKEVLYELATGHAEAGEWTNALEYGNELANHDYSFRDIGTLLDAWQQKASNT